MRKSARTQIPPFFDNDPYMRHIFVCVLMTLPQRYLFMVQNVGWCPVFVAFSDQILSFGDKTKSDLL